MDYGYYAEAGFSGGQTERFFGWVLVYFYELPLCLFSNNLDNKIARQLDLQLDDNLLEVACGSGIFLKKCTSHARHITGIDHSDIQIKLSRRRNRNWIAAGTAEFVVGDSAALPWKDNRFSAVACNCIGCFADPLRSLKEMHRVLRPGGRVVIAFDYIADEKKTRKFEQTWGKWGLNVWNDAKAAEMMDDAGFPLRSVSNDGTFKGSLITKAIKRMR